MAKKTGTQLLLVIANRWYTGVAILSWMMKAEKDCRVAYDPGNDRGFLSNYKLSWRSCRESRSLWLWNLVKMMKMF